MLLLIGIFVADSYEKRIDLQAKISENSKIFFKSQEIVLSIFIFIILIANTLCDMIISGLLSHSYELSVPIQSISDYVFLPKNLNIFQTILLLVLFETAGAFVCYHVFIITAQIMRSVKSYMIFGFILIVLSTLIPGFFPDSAVYIHIGITDKRSVLSGIQYLPILKSSNIPIILIIYFFILFGLCTRRFYKYHKKKN